jgi:hypothetical protein
VRLTHAQDKMAKKKRTRQDKIKADLRHQLPQSPVYTVSQHNENIAPSRPQPVSKTISIDKFFIEDLKRTAYLTIAILAGQVGLFIFLRNHIIKFPFISY